MQVVLHILAVIGIILLCILAFILLLTLAILFIPVRYRICFSYLGKEAVAGRFTWLFRVLHVPFFYRDGKTSCELRVFGINLSKCFGGHKKKETKDQTSKKRAQTPKKGTETTEKPKESQGENTITEETDVSYLKQNITYSESEPPDEEADAETTARSEKPVKRRENPLKKVLKKIKETFQLLHDLWRKWLQFLKKEKELAQRIKKYIAFLRDDSVSDMVCILKDNVIHLWRKLKPKKIKGYLHFGTGDPCSTGEILGFLSFLYTASRGELRIQPEFEKACFEGELEIKGRITVFTLVWILYKVVFSEEWDKFQKAYRKVRR